MKRTPTLLQFLRGSSIPRDLMPGCANYDHQRGGCLFSDTCVVESGSRCNYFEKAVLPVAAQQGYGDKMAARYGKQTGADLALPESETRHCPDCGAPLPPRARVCSDCRVKRRRKSYRAARAQK